MPLIIIILQPNLGCHLILVRPRLNSTDSLLHHLAELLFQIDRPTHFRFCTKTPLIISRFQANLVYSLIFKSPWLIWIVRVLCHRLVELSDHELIFPHNNSLKYYWISTKFVLSIDIDDSLAGIDCQTSKWSFSSVVDPVDPNCAPHSHFFPPNKSLDYYLISSKFGMLIACDKSLAEFDCELDASSFSRGIAPDYLIHPLSFPQINFLCDWTWLFAKFGKQLDIDRTMVWLDET